MRTSRTWLVLAAALSLWLWLASAGLLEPSDLGSRAATNQSTSTSAAVNVLSEPQVAQGLKEALHKGVAQAASQLGHEDGFLTNMAVRIPMPEKLQSVERTLRAFRQDKLADEFIQTMNRTAGQAVPQAARLFGQAIRQMSVADAKRILCGPKNAATQYCRRATEADLFKRLLPIVKLTTSKTGTTAAYKKFLDRVHGGLGGSLFSAESVDIDAYVTEKTLDGLFKVMAQEEARIRDNPEARTSSLLQQVFGALPQ